MSTYTVMMTATAEREFTDIVDYLSGPLDDTPAAVDVIREFQLSLTSLEMIPNSFDAVRDELLAMAGYRCLFIGSYLVLFTVDENANAVYIEHVLRGTGPWRDIV